MRGRKPKSAAQQIAEGDPSKRGPSALAEQLEREPKPTWGLPACPAHLKGHARRAWIFWVEELERMGIDRRPDAMMLEGACVAYEEVRETYEIIQKQGRLFAKRQLDPATNTLVVVSIRPHPALTINANAWIRMRSFCSEFGLSPASRTRVAADGGRDAMDDLEALLAGPRPEAVN